MENNENFKKYLKYLTEQNEFQEKRYLKEFEKLETEGFFRKLKNELIADYEFVEDKYLPQYYVSNVSKRNLINSRSLYFEKINDNQCVEIVTGLLFGRTEDNNFYNEETGLRFNFDNGFEKAIGMELDDVYLVNAINYFNYYKNLNDLDIELRSKAQSLLLKKGMKFAK